MVFDPSVWWQGALVIAVVASGLVVAVVQAVRYFRDQDAHREPWERDHADGDGSDGRGGEPPQR